MARAHRLARRPDPVLRAQLEAFAAHDAAEVAALKAAELELVAAVLRAAKPKR